MNYDTLIKILKQIKKGTFINLEFQSNPKPLATHKEDKITKVTNGTYRLGITYKNLKSKKDKETGPMAWGEWEDALENYIVTYTNKEGVEKKYLRVYTASGKHSHTKYFLNDEETSKEFLVDNRYISDRKSTPTECFNIAIENIIRIGAHQ